MTLLQEIVGRLENIETLLKTPTDEEKKDKPDDGKLIKRLKEYFKLLKTIDDKDNIILAREQTITYRDNEIIELKKRPTQDDYDKAIQAERDKHSQFRSDISTIVYPDAKVPALAKKDEDLITQSKEVVAKLREIEKVRREIEKVRDDRPDITIKLWTDTQDTMNVVNKYILQPKTLTSEEKSINPGDSELLIALKKSVKPETTEKETQTEITGIEIKQMEKDGGDLKQAITQYIPLTTYKKEAEARLKELDSTLKTYEQTQLYLKNEAKKDKDLISELTKQVKTGGLTEEQLVIKIRELEQKLVKPLMISVGTKTELSMADIAKMENTEAGIKEFVKKSMFLSEDQKQEKDDIIFKLDVIERGIIALDKDKEHNRTQGREMKKELEKLFEQIEAKKVVEEGLRKSVADLELLVKTNDLEFEEKQKQNQKDYDEINITFGEMSKKLSNVEEELRIKMSELQETLKVNENALKDREALIKDADENKERHEVALNQLEKEKAVLKTKINELLVEVNYKEKENKELAEEVNKIKNKSFNNVEEKLYGRSWKGFYEWLLNNISDYNNKEIVASNHVLIYPSLSTSSFVFYQSFLKGIRLIGDIEGDKNGGVAWSNFKPYSDDKGGKELFDFGAYIANDHYKRVQMEATALLNKYRQDTAATATLGSKSITSSNQIWNDFYWWIKNNIVKTAIFSNNTLGFREEEGKYWPGGVTSTSLSNYNVFLEIFQNQSEEFLDYDKSKNFTELLSTKTSLYGLINGDNSESYKIYFNNLLNRYRKTITIVEYKRGWADFYEWLQTNITKDRMALPRKLEIKDELKKDYPLLTSLISDQPFYSCFLASIESTFAYCITPSLGNLLPYDDTKKFQELFLKEEECVRFFDKAIEANKLLEQYRIETKTLKKQILINVPVGIVKSRTWQSFYDWLNDNVVDTNEKGYGKGNLKPSLRTKYKFLTSSYSMLGYLMNSLEINLGKIVLDYSGNLICSSYVLFLFSYDDRKDLEELIDWNKSGVNFHDFRSLSSGFSLDYRQLFQDWRKETPLQTIDGKILTQKEIDIIESIPSFISTTTPKSSIACKEIANNFTKGIPNIEETLPNLEDNILLMRNLYLGLSDVYKRLEDNNETAKKEIVNLTKQLNEANKLKQDQNKLLKYLVYYRKMMVFDLRKEEGELRFFSKINDPQERIVEAQTNFDNFMRQHTIKGPIMYIKLEEDDSVDLGHYNKNYEKLHVYIDSGNKAVFQRAEKKAELWINTNFPKIWKENSERIDDIMWRTNLSGVESISKGSSRGYRFKFL